MKMLVISVIRAVMILTGVSEAEELDETVVERYEAMASRPLRINLVERGRLVSSGLFSPYQIAALCEYKATEGDILSAAELALVDGFDADVAEALSLFVSFESATRAGDLTEERKKGKTEVEGRFGVKKEGKGAMTASESARLRYGTELLEVAVAGKRGYGARLWPPEGGTFHAEFRGRRGKVTAGDFNVRFGQGLVTWSGFEMTGLRDVSAFERRASMISSSWSYSGTGTLRGVSADMTSGKWQISGYTAFPGLLTSKGVRSINAGANVTWYGHHGQAGATVAAERMRISLDARWNIKGVNLFGEAAYAFMQRSAAVRAGMKTKLDSNTEAGILVNIEPSAFTGKKNGEYSIDAALGTHSNKYIPLRGRTGFGSSARRWTTSATVRWSLLPRPGKDSNRHEFRAVASASWQVSPSVKIALRATERLRNFDIGNRTDIRADALWSDGVRVLNARAEAVTSERWGLLSYLEAGKLTDIYSVYFRLTGFSADKWNDRVYCYERDAPGNFNSPAYYGHGYAVSAVGGWKKRFRWGTLKIYARSSWLDYLTSKPGKTGHKIQVMLEI